MDAPKINDDEGVDFGFYFSSKYQMQNERKRKAPGNNQGRPQTSERGGRGRGRGRGAEQNGPPTEVRVANKNSLAGQPNNEQKLGMMFEFIHKYIFGLFKAGEFNDKTYTYPKA